MDAKSLLKKHLDLLIPKGIYSSPKQLENYRYEATINAINEALGNKVTEFHARKVLDAIIYDGLDYETKVQMIVNPNDTTFDEEIDLFECMAMLPPEMKEILEAYEEEGDLYERCAELLAKVEPLGYTFEYGLDGIPFGLTKIVK